MTPTRTTAVRALWLALLLMATNCHAVNLGRLRGLAEVGRDLDVSVQVQFAPEEEASTACFDADVRYGEIPVERNRISVSSQPSVPAGSLQVRIQASAKVDEAVVHIILRAVCGAKASRNYVLLSDVVSDTQGPLPTVSGSPVPSATVTGRAVMAPDMVTKPIASAPNSAAGAQIPPGSTVAAPVKAPVRHAASGSSATEKPPSKATLAQAQQAALDALQQRVDELSKLQANAANAVEPDKNAEQAAALETEIRTLQQVMAKNQRNLQLVTRALESSENDAYGAWLVYALAGLLLTSLVAVGLLLQRLRTAGPEHMPWWSSGETRPATGAPSVSSPAQAPAAVVAPLNRVPVTPRQSLRPAPDHAPTEARDSSPHTMPVAVNAAPTAQVRRPGPMAGGGANLPKAINTKEMLDVRQQAEFFMALGRQDEAVALLESSIEDSAEANPLIFLDLLKIFHTLSRRPDFERYRAEFNLQFTGRVPSYADFALEGNGLETYEDICQQIVVLWPTDYAVDYIEQCLVRTAEDDPLQGIDLEAFKDLLLLYGILKRLGQGMDSGLVPFSTTRTANSQLSALASMTAGLSPEPALPELSLDADSAELDLNLDLDLDLSQNLPEAPATPDEAGQANNLMDFDMSTYLGPAATDDK